MKKKNICKCIRTGMLAAAFMVGMLVNHFSVNAAAAESREVEASVTNYGATAGADLVISNWRELNEFAQNVNTGSSYAGKTIVLSQDIVFDGSANCFTQPIGIEYKRPFAGTFDGQGHSILGLNENRSNESNTRFGLFGYIASGATVKNVTIVDGVYRGSWGGGIALSNSGTINNCHVCNGEIYARSDLGGIVAYNYGTISNCTVSGKLTQTVEDPGDIDVGGICGCNSGKLVNNVNLSDISVNYSGSAYVGGVVGYVESSGSTSATVKNCYSVGDISFGTDASTRKKGAVAGYVQGIIENCYGSYEVSEYMIPYKSSSTEVSTVKGYETTSEMATQTFVNLLNSNRGYNEDWFAWEIRGNESPYPLPVRLIDISLCQITIPGGTYVYNGREQTPQPVLKYKGVTLTADRDYTLSYANNINAGTAMIYITGTNQYLGTASATFTIDKADAVIAHTATFDKSVGSSAFSLNASVQSGEGSLSYASSDSSVASVSSGGVVTVGNTGSAVITISLPETNNYRAASVATTVNVGKTDAVISCAPEFNTTMGSAAFNLGVAIQAGTGALTYTSSDSSVAAVAPNGDVTVGTAGVAVISITLPESDNYRAATITTTVNVQPSAVVLKSVKKKGKKISVVWEKVNGVSGYEIQYSTSKKFKKAKKVNVAKNVGKKKISSVKKKKTYYIRVCTYVNKGGTKLYGAWSKVKKVKM